MGFTRTAVTLKELRGNNPNTTQTLIHFKTMTSFHTDYSNTELLARELNIDELQEVSGGFSIAKPIISVIRFLYWNPPMSQAIDPTPPQLLDQGSNQRVD